MSFPEEQHRMMTYPPPPETRTVVLYQQPAVIPARVMTHTSCGMITLGVFIILLSTAILGLAAYIWIMIGGIVDIVVASAICGSFFFFTGFFAVCGGSSVWTRQGCIIVSVSLGLLGTIVSLVAMYFASEAIRQEDKYRKLCLTCHANLFSQNLDIRDPLKIFNFGKKELEGECDFMCTFTPYALLGLLACSEGILGLLLSFVACCNICSCCLCYKAPPRNAI